MSKATETTRAGIYVRLSHDPNDLREGVARQEQDCREVAARKGWEVVEVYEDNDLSAWSGKARPRFRDMLADIERRDLDAVVIWHLDRLARDMRDLEDFIDACTRQGTKVATATGELDIGTPDGLAMARIMTTISRKSSDDSSRRIRRKMEGIAREGRPTGGGKRAFGYEQDGMTIRKDEARELLKVAKRVDAGEGLIGIARDLNVRGVKTTTGGDWDTRSLKRILTGPRWAGLAVYKGEVIGEAQWAPIIPVEMHQRLRARLLDESRSNGGTTARKHLLPGFVYCGECGKKIVSRSRGNTGPPCYQCVSVVPYGGCGRVSVVMTPLEDMVRDAVIDALTGPNLAGALKAALGDDEDQAALVNSIREADLRLEQLARDHYADRVISRSEFFAAREAIEKAKAKAERRLKNSTASKVLAALPSDAETLRKEWDNRDLGWKRAVIGAVLDRVAVSRAKTRGRNVFDPSRVEFVWRA